jgi:tRNA A37 threonylcarbamoyladenosine synthetase subunit TsaC/SUA5/YrdC
MVFPTETPYLLNCKKKIQINKQNKQNKIMGVIIVSLSLYLSFSVITRIKRGKNNFTYVYNKPANALF